MTLAEFLNRCSFARLTPELLQSCNPFKCGNEDLDEFFREDFRLYGEKLLGKTYVFRLKEHPENIVAAFTISNDSIRIKQLTPEDKAKIEYVTENGEKNLHRYPGVLVGRLGTPAVGLSFLTQSTSRKSFITTRKISSSFFIVPK